MSDPATQIAHALSRLAAFWRAAGWQSAGARGLTPTQVDILQHVAARGPLRGGDLARFLGVTAPTLTDAANALVAKGLAQRCPDPDDRRANRLSLTDAGAGMIAALPDMPDPLRPVIAALPEAERGSLLRGLVQLIRGLQQAEAIPTQRMCVTCRHFRPHAHDDAARPHHCAFVDAAFGDAALRIDCADHGETTAGEGARIWARFAAVA